MASFTEAKLEGLFENCQKATFMSTYLSEMGHQQPPALVATDNTASNSIVNGTAKQKIYQSIGMGFYWVRDRIRQNYFHILWEEGKKNVADYITRHHPIKHHTKMRPRYVKATKKDMENSKDRWAGTRRSCTGTNNPGGNQKPDNPLKRIRDLVQNRTRIQWPRGVTVPTKG